MQSAKPLLSLRGCDSTRGNLPQNVVSKNWGNPIAAWAKTVEKDKKTEKNKKSVNKILILKKFCAIMFGLLDVFLHESFVFAGKTE